jgi:WD40 repeat protein
LFTCWLVYLLSRRDLDRLDAPLYSVKGHSSVINAIDGCGGLGIGGGAPEIVTGGRDGAVKVWDLRQPGGPVADMSPGDDSDVRDCWTVAFGAWIGVKQKTKKNTPKKK